MIVSNTRVVVDFFSLDFEDIFFIRMVDACRLKPKKFGNENS